VVLSHSIRDSHTHTTHTPVVIHRFIKEIRDTKGEGWLAWAINIACYFVDFQFMFKGRERERKVKNDFRRKRRAREIAKDMLDVMGVTGKL